MSRLNGYLPVSLKRQDADEAHERYIDDKFSGRAAKKYSACTMPVHDCTDCDGRGGARVEEPGEPSAWWKCEGCDASGKTTSCVVCGDPMSLPEADEHGYHCVVCRDAEDRLARERAIRGDA